MSLSDLKISSALEVSGQSGVFSNKGFSAGDTILVLSGSVLTNPTRTSICVGEDTHIEDPVGAFINHSCNPSCKIINYSVIAVRDICIDDEITFDYSSSELVLSNPFVCSCCNKLID